MSGRHAPVSLTGTRSDTVRTQLALSRARERRAADAAVAEGPASVEYALRVGALEVLFVREDQRAQFGDLLEAARARQVAVHVVSGATADRMSDTANNQGLIGRARCVVSPQVPPFRLAVLLAAVQDPGNVGAIIRSADAFGVDCVLVGPATADPTSAKVVRASAGSSLGVRLVRIDSVIETINAASESSVVLGAAVGGDPTFFGEDFRLDADGSGSVMLVLGNEKRGLAPEMEAACTSLVSIPMCGNVESLNVGSAAAICLFEIRRKLGYPN